MSFFFLFIILFSVPFVAAQNASQYQSCQETFDCGEIIDVGYPFWGSNRPDYCGHPKFRLNCTDTAHIQINGLTYRVLDIFSEATILKVAREDYMGGMCPDPLVNTTLDSQVMFYAWNTMTFSLYYDCPIAPFSLASNVSNSFTCNNRSGLIATRYLRGLGNLTLNGYAESCGTKVVVPAVPWAVESVKNVTPANLLAALEEGFEVRWNANNSLCDACRESGGVCGYSSSFVCYCSDGQRQPFTCPVPSPPQMPPSVTISGVMVLIIGVTPSAATIIITSLGCYHCYKRKIGIWKGRKLKPDENVEAFILDYHSHMPQRYSYSSIKRMTNSFSDKLGQGGFGGVYKGKLLDGRLVAVKLLKESVGDGKEFINEVASISRTSHVNIVTLLGFCYEKTKRALVYEYMPNGSLDKFVCRNNEGFEVGLLEKIKSEIAIGIARGLEYLHRGCNTRIVHFDIKPHNILLDQDFCPKIADFGLAKLCKRKESIVSMLGARGTAGYIAPEVFMRGYGGVSYKSDVYSYGMMMLEMFAGKQTVMDNRGMETNSDTYFPDFIYKNLERGEICGRDEEMADEEEETVKRMVIVGLWCIQTNPTERPSMTKVIEMLEGTIELLQLPPKPALFSSPKPLEFLSSSTYIESSLDKDKISIVTP